MREKNMTREQSSKERTIRIIGIGNEYRSDDGIGLMIARKIRELNLPNVAVLELPDDGGGLMGAWTDADSVVLIDAVSSGSIPGTIVRFDASDQTIPSDLFHYSTHAFSVAESIELAKVIGKLPERCLVFGIEGKNFCMGTTISPVVLEAAGNIVKMILCDINTIVACTSPKA